MTRKRGSRDLRRRKRRSDKGSKRKLYKGKPVKTRRQILFERRRGNKTSIKIWIWEEKRISVDGYLRWNRHVRRFARPIIYKPLIVHQVETEEINTRQKIQDFVAQNYWAGTFLVMGFTHKKNKYHCSPCKICKIIVTETENGNIGRMTNNYRLSRYRWFYHG